MNFVMKYHFSAAEGEANYKSTHCQNVTNYSFITRICMMQGNKLQSTDYQPVRQNICLQAIQCKVTQPTVDHYHFTQLSKFDDINHVKIYKIISQ